MYSLTSCTRMYGPWSVAGIYVFVQVSAPTNYVHVGIAHTLTLSITHFSGADVICI